MDLSKLKGKRVFVSGGAGVIGQEMIPMLSDAGAVIFVGDLKPIPEGFPEMVRYRQGDLNTLTHDEIAAFAPEIFIHLAATFERSTETYAFWQENFWHNIRLSNHLAGLVKDLPSLKRVVFASSYLIYDPALYQFVTPPASSTRLKETDPVYPRNLTGMAKLAHEIELRFLDGFRRDSFTTVSARIYRGYGCNSRDVISRWIRDLLDGREIQVFRSEGRFDYIYAADTAAGLLHLAAHPKLSGIVNLGTGKSRRVSDIVDILKTHFPDMRSREVESDIPHEASEADMTLFSRQTTWKPQFTLESAIRRMVEFEKQARSSTKTTPPGHILLTSASAKVPMLLAIREAARKLHPDIRVFAGDIQPDVPSRYVADGFVTLPATTDKQTGRLMDICLENGITTIIPSRDGELLFWAQNREKFAKAGIHVFVSDGENVENCIDKLKFCQFGQTAGIPVIPTVEKISDIRADRLVVKERYGAGSRSIAINVDAAEAEKHAKSLHQVIFQPFIDGREVSVDAWLDRHSRVKGLILRNRVKIVNGESQITTTFTDEKLASACSGYLESLGLRGHAMLQLIIDADGRHHVLESNARFGGASTLSVRAGLDSFYWSLLEKQGADLSRYPFIRATGELTQVRAPSDIIRHDTNL